MKGHQKADRKCSGRCLRWYFVTEGSRDEGGKRKRQWSKGYPTRKAASAALTAEFGRRDQGIRLSSERLTVRQLAARWLEHLAVLGRDARTRERYEELLTLHVFPELGSMLVRELEPGHLTALYGKLLREGRKDGKAGGLKARTVGHVHRAVHGMLRFAVRQRILALNVASDLELPTIPRSTMAMLTREQARKLLDAAEAAAHRPWLSSFVLLGVATGARLGELLALTWRSVDLDAGTVRIGASRRIVGGTVETKGPKTESGYRTVNIGAVTVAALRKLHTAQAQRRLALGAAYDVEGDWVICKPDGSPYRPDSVSNMFRRFVDDSGLPKSVHVHTLRHSAASFLAAAGVPASDIAAQLGHADGGSLALRVYVHATPEGLAKAGNHLDAVVGAQG